jgi:hypothetical protein
LLVFWEDYKNWVESFMLGFAELVRIVPIKTGYNNLGYDLLSFWGTHYLKKSGRINNVCWIFVEVLRNSSSKKLGRFVEL